jgi:hypothetical protein
LRRSESAIRCRRQASDGENIKEFVDIIAGEERANVLTAIAFLVIAVTKGEDRQLREDMISAVADLARSALPGRQRTEAAPDPYA